MESLTGLLIALATNAAQGFGAELWGALRAVLSRPESETEASQRPEVTALDALTQSPFAPAGAAALQRAIAERADVDPEFHSAVTAWASDARHALSTHRPNSDPRDSGQGPVHITAGPGSVVNVFHS